MYTYVDTNLQHFAILFTYCVSFLPYNNRYVQERGPKSPLKPISRRKGDGVCLYTLLLGVKSSSQVEEGAEKRVSVELDSRETPFRNSHDTVCGRARACN